jgi:hypothetical protein
MGRIPKSVKEKALAEHRLSSSSTENEDPNNFSVASLSPSINSNSNQFPSNDFDLELIDEQLSLDDIDTIPFDKSSATLPSCMSYILPDNFTIVETKHDEDGDLFSLNRSVLTNCTVNCEEQFSKNIIERIQNLIIKISQPIIRTELNHEESSFIRYLRWKMFDLCNTFNGGTRQLFERMNSMIKLGVNKIFVSFFYCKFIRFLG